MAGFYIHLGRGDGTFLAAGESRALFWAGPRSMVAVDADSNGRTDVAFIDAGKIVVLVSRGQPAGDSIMARGRLATPGYASPPCCRGSR